MTWTVKQQPFVDFKSFQDDLNRVFGGAFAGVLNDEVPAAQWSPRVDVYEDEHAIKLEADLPGVKPEDFKLSIENFKLTLSGERKFAEGENKENWHRVERRYGSFSRNFTLPTTVNVEDVKAEFKDGVLRITLPKREEVKPRTIRVEVKNGEKTVETAQS
jgi:HSP20 family protein